MSNKVVFFTTNNARVQEMDDASHLRGVPNVAVDPDLKKVHGVAPHYWKLVKGQVLPLSDAERVDRDAHHARHGVDNEVRVDVKAHRRSYKKLRSQAIAFALGAAAVILAWKLLR